MPAFDGTGPFGYGAGTGRGGGYCVGSRRWGRGFHRGFGMRRGAWGGWGYPASSMLSKEDHLRAVEADIASQESMLEEMKKQAAQLRDER